MKKLPIILISFITGIIAFFASCTIIPIAGNGHLVTSERIVSSFQKINSGSSVEIRFNTSPEYRVVVTADSNLIEFVTSEIRNNTLYIEIKNGNYSFTKILVEIYSPVLTSVSISGSGSFESNDKVTSSIFETNVSGSGYIKVTLESEIFSSIISGSGNIYISGNNDNSNIKISGSGKFNGNEFITKYITINISGSGIANIFVTDNLNAIVSGSGEINYRGNPSDVKTNISGSGKINRL